MTERDLQRFWRKVDSSGGQAACWPWLACRDTFGHGRFRLGKNRVMAHRLAYELATGQHIPEGAVVRHLCNNPTCCNPAHLAVGTHADNVADRVAAGRSARGEHNGRAKLTWAAVAAIRQQAEAGTSDCQLARQFAVSRRCISFIRAGSHWRID